MDQLQSRLRNGGRNPAAYGPIGSASVAPQARPVPSIAIIVAVIGCDGSGKTRLAKDIVSSLMQWRAVERRYMGLVSGETGDQIKQLPVIGKALERFLAAKVRRAQDMKNKLPGTFSAVVMYLFSLWRVRKLRLMMKRAESGVLMIAERYPQAEMPGFHYDGSGLSVDRSINRLVRALARHEQRLYEKMAEQKPSLVIRLAIDADTAYARKPDHPLDELQEKTKKMALIKFNGAHIVEIDATRPYEEVLAAALAIIEQTDPALERSRS